MRYGTKTLATVLVVGALMACGACSQADELTSVVSSLAKPTPNPSPTIAVGTTGINQLIWAGYGVAISVTELQIRDFDGAVVLRFGISNSRSEDVTVTTSYITINRLIVDGVNTNMGWASSNHNGMGSLQFDKWALQYAGVEQVGEIGFTMNLSWDDGLNAANIVSSPIDIHTDLCGQFQQPIDLSSGQIVIQESGLVVRVIGLTMAYPEFTSQGLLLSIDHRDGQRSIVVGVDGEPGASNVNGQRTEPELRAEIPGNSVAFVGVRFVGLNGVAVDGKYTVHMTLTVQDAKTGDITRYPVTVSPPNV